MISSSPLLLSFIGPLTPKNVLKTGCGTVSLISDAYLAYIYKESSHKWLDQMVVKWVQIVMGFLPWAGQTGCRLKGDCGWCCHGHPHWLGTSSRPNALQAEPRSAVCSDSFDSPLESLRFLLLVFPPPFCQIPLFLFPSGFSTLGTCGYNTASCSR